MLKSAIEQNCRPFAKMQMIRNPSQLSKAEACFETKQGYVSRTAIAVNTTDTRLDLLRVESLHTLIPTAAIILPS